MQRSVALVVAALSLAGLGSFCARLSAPSAASARAEDPPRPARGEPPFGEGGKVDPVVAGIYIGAALAATARANQTPGFPSNATPTPVAAPSDQESLDLLLRALYEGVSHGEDSEPDWARLSALFAPGARLTPPKHGGVAWRALSFDEFREAAREGIALRKRAGKPAGFFEQEIGREATSFGSMTVVLSAYEARFRKEDEKPLLRGVNSIQAVRAGDRWAIVSIVWDTEGPDNPIPERLLGPP